MSIDSVTKIYDWMEKARPAKVFWVLLLFVYGVLLFEQFTGHYRLIRLEKSIAVMEALQPGPVRDAVQTQVEHQSAKLFVPKQTSPFFVRMACGGSPFLLAVLMALFAPQGFGNFCKVLFNFIFIGGMIALIPDFLPTWKECLYAMGVYIFGAILNIIDTLYDPRA